MTRLSLPFLLLLIGCFQGYGQGYRSIPFNTVAHFEIKDSAQCSLGTCLYSYKIDSVVPAINGDTVWHIKPVVNPDVDLPGNCLYPTNDTSIFGTKMIAKPDGRDIFFNKYGDTITMFRYRADFDPWAFYVYDNGDFIEAVVIQNNFALANHFNFYFLTQFIKLQGKNSLGQDIPGPFNGKIIKKAFWQGIWETVSFHDFPEDTTLYTLAGATNRPPGFVDFFDTLNVEAYDIFDFALGQEFHYRIEDKTGGNDLLTFERLFVNQKYVSAAEDSLVYDFRRVQVVIDQSLALPDTTIVEDTVTVAYALNGYSYLDAGANHLIQDSPYGDGYMQMFYNDKYHGRIQKVPADNYSYNSGMKCLEPSAELPTHEYAYRLGQTYWYDEPTGGGSYEQELIYYQLGLEEWGSPYDFSEYPVAVNRVRRQQLLCYPNPAKNTLMLKWPKASSGNLDIIIFDVMGKEVMRHRVKSGSHQISLDLYPIARGIYLLNVQSADGHALYRTKFLKQ